MVADNDNGRGRRANVVKRGIRNVRNVNVTRENKTPYTLTPITLTRVTDDFGGHIEVRYGERIILGKLIDDVIAGLAAKKANDR